MIGAKRFHIYVRDDNSVMQWLTSAADLETAQRKVNEHANAVGLTQKPIEWREQDGAWYSRLPTQVYKDLLVLDAYAIIDSEYLHGEHRTVYSLDELQQQLNDLLGYSMVIRGEHPPLEQPPYFDYIMQYYKQLLDDWTPDKT